MKPEDLIFTTTPPHPHLSNLYYSAKKVKTHILNIWSKWFNGKTNTQETTQEFTQG